MREEVVLITGANGEIGHGLIDYLSENGYKIVAIDLNPLDKELRPKVAHHLVGDILDQLLLGRLVVEYKIRTIYHLASILSTKAEYNPETAHRINVEGTLNLLRLAVEQSKWQGEPVKSEHISISFVPEGEGRPSSAWLNADGTFEAVYSPQAKGVQVGKCTMRLTWLADVGGACPEELAPMFKKYGPASEGYQMDVQKGNRKIVIALE